MTYGNQTLSGVSQTETLTTSGPAAVPQPRLVKAAHEFEAAMMKELMTSLQPKHGVLGDADEDTGSESALSSFAGDALGKALSERGGFGIASRIIHQLTAKSNHSGNPPVPKRPTINTAHSPSQ